MQNNSDLITQYKKLHYGNNTDKGYDKPIWKLMYRGGEVCRNKTYAYCKQKMYSLLKSNPLNYKKVFFDIKF